MDIIDIQPGSEITITVKRINKGAGVLEFHSRAINKLANTILIEEVTDNNNNPISFASDDIYVEVMSLNSRQQPVIWKNVCIRHISIGGKNYHRIAQTAEGKATNRRNAYRLPVNKSAVAQLGLNTKGINIILRDMSTGGFSFIAKDDIDISSPINIRVIVVFGNTSINLSGIVIRKQQLPDRQDFLYACKTNRFNKELDKFIMQQQREQARQKNS